MEVRRPWGLRMKSSLRPEFSVFPGRYLSRSVWTLEDLKQRWNGEGLRLVDR